MVEGNDVNNENDPYSEDDSKRLSVPTEMETSPSLTVTVTPVETPNGEEVDATAAVTLQNQEHQPIVDMKDVWATSEGYTPLQDFNLMQSYNNMSDNIHGDDPNVTAVTTGAFFSDGTTGGTIYTSFPGAFYANIAQQQPQEDDHDWENDDHQEGQEGDEVDTDAYLEYNYLHNEDDDGDDDIDDGEMATTATTTTTNTTSTSFYDSIPDYRSVADNALSMLDREYNNIISLEQQQRLSADSQPLSLEVDSDDEDSDDEPFQFSIDNDTEETNEEITDAASIPPSFLASEETTKVLKHIDTEAVRRAVQTIQLKNPKFEQNLHLWEKKQHLPPLGTTQLLARQQHSSLPYTHPQQHCMTPRLHPIIPELPLTAFRKYTSAKAIQATANLTRSVCIAEALHRYNIIQYHVHQEQTIRIHVLGCDHVEIGYHNANERSNGTAANETYLGYDIARIRTLFGPIVRWVGAYAEAPSHIHIELIGPNIPSHVATSTHTSPIDLLPNTVANSTTDNNSHGTKQTLQSATLRCHSGTYEDILKNDTDTTNDIGVPDLAIAFNAGIWGYQEWVTTIRYLIQHQVQSIPFIITAYTFEEAEDDYDTIADIVKQCSTNDHNKQVQCIWDVEHNPFASNQDHASNLTASTSSHHSSRRRENAAWQSWRL